MQRLLLSQSAVSHTHPCTSLLRLTDRRCVSSSSSAGLPTSLSFRPSCSRHQLSRSSGRCRGIPASKGERPVAQQQKQQKEDRSAGRDSYRPASYQTLIDDAATAILTGLSDGLTRLEVELPSVEADSYKGASDMYIDTNIQLAIAAAQQIRKTGRTVHLVLPDAIEYKRSYKMFKSALDLNSGITMGYLTEDKTTFLGSLFGGNRGSGSEPQATRTTAKADVFMALNASTVELVDLEKYTQEVVKDKPIILWNLELDTLRADLGLLGFPSKELQYRFLSAFKPVFYIRQRDYSKSVSVAPFIINYSGALFREYPGPWQVMLRQQDRTGTYVCVAEDRNRFNLGQFKEELMIALGLNTEEEGSAMSFLRRGYKTSTWWEDDFDQEQSHEWRR